MSATWSLLSSLAHGVLTALTLLLLTQVRRQDTHHQDNSPLHQDDPGPVPVCVTLLAYLCPRLAAAVLDSWDTEGSWLQALARTVARSSP